MVFDLSPGDVVRIGAVVTLTFVAVEDDLIRFRLESPEEECPGAGMGCEEADLNSQPGWWQLN